MSSRSIVVAALALAGVLGAGMAQAHGGSDVQWSVTIGTPVGVPVYTQPAPVYAPAPVYVQPAPVYVRPAPGYYYVQPSPYSRPRGYHRASRWDADGDGIPNRRDRLYNPAWDRDGDGIPNRHDRYNNLRHDRDGDGIPNWADRRDGRR
ncbi:hypothetical protein [Azohydromonas aeria]|uniref:hypothetical protein n=1 Tax=Azohydromonas aeria TaxID=2590212 RepID=UPI0012F9C5ED|nr:hypothetical protein [Azohydromonas aeria]